MGTAEKKRRVRKVPEYLIKEVLDGVPVYYKGYREVLNGKKTKEEVMADGLLQAFIKMWLAQLLLSHLDKNRYFVLTGEIGSHISPGNNASHDLVIFEKKTLPPSKITNHYADVPAKVVLEVDTEVEYGKELSIDIYVQQKTQRTLDFGTERVIWIFTATRKVLIAVQGQDWIICDWNKPIEILDGVAFNVAEYLEQEGIRLDEPQI